MKPLIDPINTSDGQFHPINTQTGEKATIVTPDYMNDSQDATRSLQRELISILTASGIKPAEATDNQLLTALKKLFLDEDDDRVSGALQKGQNLADVDDADASLKNLGGYPLSGGALNGPVIPGTTEAGLQKDASSWNEGASSNKIFQVVGADTSYSVVSDFYLSAGNYWAWRVYLGKVDSVHVLDFRSDGTLRAPGDVYAGEAHLATDGNINGTCWGGFLNTWIVSKISAAVAGAITGIRLATSTWAATGSSNWSAPSGAVMNGVGIYTGAQARYAYIQVCIGGQWVNISTV
ncbi:hypothetical protein NG99_04540 [Erwinia typographi]|uniref:Tail fiber protein n=1 Tax=Erwinia typographi TaxID=371042 RepID=A0A0A3Z873_9GAMM|nr:hypothetical protein [Erwinia typographi]KGT95292.1 hypothetical protein NG99_04540 [Erwinia typographi]